MTGTIGPVTAVIVDVTQPGMRATSTSFLAFIQNLLGLAFGPLLAGALADVYGLGFALSVVPALSLPAALMFALAARTYLADMRRVADSEPATGANPAAAPVTGGRPLCGSSTMRDRAVDGSLSPPHGSGAAPAPEGAHEGRDAGITKRRRDVVEREIRIREQLPRNLEPDPVENFLERFPLGLQAPVQRASVHREHLGHIVAPEHSPESSCMRSAR